MKRKPILYTGAAAFLVFVAFGVVQTIVEHRTDATPLRQNVQAPAFAVDPMWPRPLPTNWVLGSVTGVAVDAQDNIWVVNRPSTFGQKEIYAAQDPPMASCCVPAPPVLKFSPTGELLASWGGPGQGYQWPAEIQGILVDPKGNVWIGGGGAGTIEGRPEPPPAPTRGGRGGAARQRGPQDAHVLKFSGDGKFLLQIGKPGDVDGSQSRNTLNLPSSFAFDAEANEIYVADGGTFRSPNGSAVYGNRRIVVFDADTGAYKRHWGAYGNAPADADVPAYQPNGAAARQFRSVSCVRIARDGFVYVCDRESNRIQVFQKDGKFVREQVISPSTVNNGAVWDIAFSNDAQQRFLFVANGQDKKVLVLVRETLEVVTRFGSGGRQPGLFIGVGSLAVDSRGNLYTGETYEGKRVQKFSYQGLRSVSNR